ncbi:MAG TPA: hypothetical protein VEV61_18685 [Streptosporangiaceae bacterium]|nr:hypothetical protein [Streptosporangiaceae bacterium]
MPKISAMQHVRVGRLASGLALAFAMTACTAQSGGPSAAVTSHVPASASPTPSSRSRASWPPVMAVPAVRARLHQTHALPPAHSPVFHAEMTDLWAAVVTGRPRLGMPAFFPLPAYEQVKAIADPASDWRNRLVAEFRLDVVAAHRLLRRSARHAVLTEVLVPESQASWIDPGVCYNKTGYWHVAGARIGYKVRGRLRSIGIASLISWRGRWYVVHFGAVLRTTAGGVVDQPARGLGVPGPAGGC